jgi:hypothetical protein
MFLYCGVSSFDLQREWIKRHNSDNGNSLEGELKSTPYVPWDLALLLHRIGVNVEQPRRVGENELSPFCKKTLAGGGVKARSWTLFGGYPRENTTLLHPPCACQ